MYKYNIYKVKRTKEIQKWCTTITGFITTQGRCSHVIYFWYYRYVIYLYILCTLTLVSWLNIRTHRHVFINPIFQWIIIHYKIIEKHLLIQIFIYTIEYVYWKNNFIFSWLFNSDSSTFTGESSKMIKYIKNQSIQVFVDFYMYSW